MRRLSYVCFILLFLPLIAFSQGGETGFASLKSGSSARAMGMGDLGIAAGKGPMSMHYNPAIIAERQNAGISFTHSSQALDISTQYLGAVAALEGYSLGFHVMYTGIGEGELREVPGPSEGTFDSYYLSTGITVALPLFERFEAGLSAKILFEKIYVDDAAGYAFDLGARYRPFADGTHDGLGVGVSIANLGSMSALRDSATTLPSLLRYGVSHPFQLGTGRSNVLVTAGGVTNFAAGITHAAVGAEFAYDGIAYLRAGYQSGYDTKGLSFGAGVEFSVLRFDFAYLPATGGFSDETAISLILAL